MAKRGKKYKKALEALGGKKLVPLRESVALLKSVAHARFDESVSVDVNLGIDASKGDQVVRGGIILPKGTGRKARVLVFAKGEYADKATAAGADFVGAEDLVKKIEDGWFDFEYAVATPDLMGLVGKVAKILGPLGLLPNKKLGTVTFDVTDVVKDLKKGLTFFRNDKQGLVHFMCGKLSFSEQDLHENVEAFLKALAAAKPQTSKGKFIKKVVITPTMGPGIQVDVGTL
ncbi:MAG: 50S ribosomal protein L1 [candidate division TM6 bacterium GW2011_GWE2_42_60]|nr:MAG: 50S ribosomal protein L1 [candidate division TM6 bacterium GW2011_GWE2_42_60]HBY05697.1 50S ribosomal protein L1 [Candidatus Dependentiae bacterium]